MCKCFMAGGVCTIVAVETVAIAGTFSRAIPTARTTVSPLLEKRVRYRREESERDEVERERNG